MKRVCIILIILSSVAMGGKVNLEANPVNETSIFQTGQEWAIDVKGNITSASAPIKYVIYTTSNKDNPDGPKLDILKLPDFHMQVDEGKGFISTPPTVFVRRVSGIGQSALVVPLSQNEYVEFGLERDPAYGFGVSWFGIVEGDYGYLNPTQFLSVVTLDNIVKNIDDSRLKHYLGVIYEEEKNRNIKAVYTPKTGMKVSVSSTKGFLTFKNSDIRSSEAPITNLELINKIEAAFSREQNISKVKVFARIK